MTDKLTEGYSLSYNCKAMTEKDQSNQYGLQQQWMDQLTSEGYRITRPLKILISILATSDRILNPSQVFQSARQMYPKIGLVTVYRTMEKLEQAGLISRVHMPDGCQSFFQSQSGHQHLIICSNCGKAEYFEGDNLNLFFHSIGSNFGYQVQDHWLQLFGTCLLCQQSSQADKKE